MYVGAKWRSKETWVVSDDGLWDIGIGLALLGFGLTVSLDHPIWFIGFVLLAFFLVVMAGKEVITRPRMGSFEIGDAQLLKLVKAIRLGLVVLLLALGSSAIMFMVFDIKSTPGWLSNYSSISLNAILSSIFILFSYLTTKRSRYFVYSGLIFSAFLVCQIFDLPILQFVYSSVVLLIFSELGLLIRFFARYPRTDLQGGENM